MIDTSARRLFVALLALCLVAGLAIRLAALDRTLFATLNGAASGWPDALLAGTTLLGQGVCALMLLAPALVRAPRVLAAALYATPIGLLLTHLPKHLLGVPRPARVLDAGTFHQVGMALANDNSMPSGHAITAFVAATVLVLASPAVGSRLRWTLAAFALALAVAASRVAVGAHWPSDVLVGAALGGLSGAAGTALACRYPALDRRGGRRARALALGAAAATLPFAHLGYPEAVLVQWVLATFGALWAAVGLRHWVRERSGSAQAMSRPHAPVSTPRRPSRAELERPNR